MTENTAADTSPPSTPSAPTWVAMAGYTVEKLHTNILARSLEPKTPAARTLAAALWKRACDETIDPEHITDVSVHLEVALGKGRHSVVDLVVELTLGQEKRSLAIEVKVDGPPDARQLGTMARSYEVGAKKTLVLLCLGGAQACRLEYVRDLKDGFMPRRWAVKDILELGPLIEAASPAPGVTRDWLAELEIEERRRTMAYEDAATRVGLPYRGRSLDVYRYYLAAEALRPDGGDWDISVQPRGVVMTERSKTHEFKFKGKRVVVFLQVNKGILRVKAGSYEDGVDPRAATKHFLEPIRAALRSHGFDVVDGKQTKGRYVSLLKLAPYDGALPRDEFVAKLKRAFTAWNAIQWPK